jgi:hypothetical protein
MSSRSFSFIKKNFIVFYSFIISVYAYGVNPFERPGSRQAKPPNIIRQAPPPPAPKPLNPNIELRGMFFYEDEWYFSLHDRQKNKGAWLKVGESFDDGKVEVIGYDEENDKVKLKGGFSLQLKGPSNLVLPVPSGQPVKNLSPGKNKISSPKRQIISPTSNRVPPRITSPKR